MHHYVAYGYKTSVYLLMLCSLFMCLCLALSTVFIAAGHLCGAYS